MALSGLVGAGAATALDEVLERRLKEEIRLQQERQAAADLDLRRQQQASLENERAEDRKFRAGQVARQDAETTIAGLTPGEIPEGAAKLIGASPAHASRVSQRKIIEGVRPIAGTGGLDMSGPQSINVLEPTQAQAETALKKTQAQDVFKRLGRAGDEGSRRAIAAEALGSGIDTPNALIAPTQTELTSLRLADERRTNAENDRRAYRDEQLMRDRPLKVKTELDPGQKINATRALRNDFIRETKSAREMGRQHQMMSAGMDAAKRGDRAAGFQAVLVWIPRAWFVRRSTRARNRACA